MNKVFFLISFLCLSTVVYSQTGVGAFGGIGFPEYIHGGFRLRGPKIDIGFLYGSGPVSGKMHNLGGHILGYFRNSNSLSKSPVYLRGDLLFNMKETDYSTYRTTFFDIRIGKDFNVGRNLHIQIDLGPAFVISESENKKAVVSPDLDLDISIPLLPSGSLIFYVTL